MAKAVLTFALYSGDAFERREQVTQDIVKVGKDPKSHLRVDDELASRMHAVIEVAGPDDITLIDLGNEPGTMVNGARVNKCKLHVGDIIQVGTTQIALESADGAPAEAAAGFAQAPRAPAPPMPNQTMPMGQMPQQTMPMGQAFGGAPAAGSNPFAAAAASSPFAAAGNPFEV